MNRSEVGASLEGPAGRGRPDPVLRLGLASVRGVGEATAERIVAGRPWAGGEDLVRRAGATQAQLETLAAAGALDPEVPEERRHRRPPGAGLLWAAGAAAQGTPDRLPGMVVGAEAPPLPEPSLYDSVGDDLWALGLAPERTAMHLARERLEAMGVVVAGDAGRVHRRRPGLGGRRGDAPPAPRDGARRGLRQPRGRDRPCERGLLPRAPGPAGSRWPATRPCSSSAGRLQLGQGTVNLTAERVEALAVGTAVPASRDFR